MMCVGKKIKQKRLEKGLTQDELARKMGYKSKSTINKIEIGVNDITQSKIIKFAKVLDTTPAYLMGWRDEPKKEVEINAEIMKACKNEKLQKRLAEYAKKLNELEELETNIKNTED